MTKLQHLHTEYDQSPWRDNITRRYLCDGTLARMVNQGIRGVTAGCAATERPPRAPGAATQIDPPGVGLP